MARHGEAAWASWVLSGVCKRMSEHCAKKAPLDGLGHAKEMSKVARPHVRSCILVDWVWGKAWTPISIWLECMVLGSCMKNPRPLPAEQEEMGIRAVLQTSRTRQTS